MVSPILKIGVDVGGTNTDGVILEPTASASPGRGILAAHKASTTADPSDGIAAVVARLLRDSSADPASVASVTIGTTHFINAVVEGDASRLARVTVVRLCGPFSADIPAVHPAADVVLSKDVAHIGFLERENAAILNASILPFARRTIRAFRRAVARLGLTCPVFVTQNDGTVLPAAAAARLPIRTFSSGPTNSMRGAAFLTKHLGREETMMVVDIGGTTTDVGLLLANGFPRQAAAYSEVAGVRTNFSCPDVRSIGLGGGSVVRKGEDGGGLVIGPQSVGYQIRQKALVFGGDIATSTDYTVLADPELEIGDRSLAERAGLRDDLPEFKAKVRAMLERIIDTMKTSPEDIPVVLVGGGAVIAPDSLAGASRVIKPEWAGVANAIGAATARVSGVVDSIESTETKTSAEVIKELSQRAVDKAVENGASRESVTIAEIESFPLQYIANKASVIIKAVGDFDLSRTRTADADPILDVTEEYTDEPGLTNDGQMKSSSDASEPPSQTISYSKAYIDGYRPKVIDRQWHLSETDLDWITIGCYILGTGGGGSPYQHMLRLREMMRAGATVRIVSPFDLKDDDIVACGGGKGSPQVSIEKPYGDEIMESQRELYAYLGTKPTAVISLEIGGGNGLQGLILGASTNLDVPTVDGDWMGRAYPVSHQTTPVVFEKKATMIPSCISDGNGRIMLMTKARTELDAERAFRAALSQMGSHVGCAKGPVSGRDTKSWVVENTVSLSWRIGRAVALARCTNTVDAVAEAIVDQVGGEESARVLFRGKIVGVERVTRAGHAYGEVIIESSASYDGANGGGGERTGVERIKIPFKNENILAKKVHGDGTEEVRENRPQPDSEMILAIVPDLVCVIDAQNGEAIGTQEYRYGLLVVVLGITASEKWTSTARGIDIGGPKGFDMDDVEYVPLGKFKKPRSVIEEFGA
ncbi:hypothetical protein LY78DRAFT_588339 [Colletotrichum sublineola]|nr:hypothetical protein LY78DRAFT_588339 [Colletotrichum sublineola]